MSATTVLLLFENLPGLRAHGARCGGAATRVGMCSSAAARQAEERQVGEARVGEAVDRGAEQARRRHVGDEQALDDRRRRRRKVVAGPEQLLEVLDDLVADLVRAGQVGVAGAGLQDPFAGSSLRTLVVLQEKIPISEQ